MTELSIIESKALREQVAGRVEVLDKVKELLLLPELEMMTIQQVADYYEVGAEVVQKCYRRNKDEISMDGASKISVKSMVSRFGQDVQIVSHKSYKDTKLSDDVTFRVPNVGILLFPKRAILRIGMLLRDSEVAREVRTQLLNTFEHAPVEARTQELETETEIAARFGLALAKGDQAEAIAVYAELMQYCNRYKESNKMLAGEILRWDDRKCVNKAVRIIAGKSDTTIPMMWKRLYDELRYKHSIGLSQRGRAPLIQHIREEEWPAVQQSLTAICEKCGLSPAEIFEKSKLEAAE